MSVQTSQTPSVDELEAGVIKDARSRQRRQRGIVAIGIVLLAGIVGLALIGTRAGGDASRIAVPPPGATTGDLRPLPRSDYQYWVTPSLIPGDAALDVNVQFPGGSRACEGDCVNGGYPGVGQPVGVIESAGAGVHAPVPDDISPDVILLVAPNVAAVRIGSFGIVGAQSAPGLPDGDKLAAFVVPQRANARFSPRHGVPVTALTADGVPLRTPSLIPSFPLVPPGVRPRRTWTAHGGACTVTPALQVSFLNRRSRRSRSSHSPRARPACSCPAWTTNTATRRGHASTSRSSSTPTNRELRPRRYGARRRCPAIPESSRSRRPLS